MLISSPSNNLFAAALLTIQAILLLSDSRLDVRKGSSIRLLVVRPCAYIYAKFNTFINSWLKRTSVSLLKKSLLTLDLIADMIASNYFVYRNLGTRAKGTILLTLSSSTSFIPASTKFFIADSIFNPRYTYVVTDLIQLDTDSTKYIKAKPINNQYKAIIEVAAQLPLYLLIPEGSLVTTSNYIQDFEYALVFSPISDGSLKLTNASLMSRCLSKCTSAMNTYRSILTRLILSGLSVISCSSVGSVLPGQLRSMYNSSIIPISGSIDTYVKTSNQPALTRISIPKNDFLYILIVLNNVTDTWTRIEIDTLSESFSYIAGLYSIKNIYTGDAKLNDNIQWHLLFNSSDPYTMNNLGARLSLHQSAILLIHSKILLDVSLDVLYMPNIKNIQQYINNYLSRFVCLDIVIKAAIPIRLYIDCRLLVLGETTYELIQSMRLYIVRLVNSYKVGALDFNMSLLGQRFRKKYPNALLKLPYAISCSVLLQDGSYYSFFTNDGLLSIAKLHNSLKFLAQGYFYYTTTLLVNLRYI